MSKKYIKGCLLDDDGRECNKCGEYKLWGSFYQHKKRGSYYGKCKQCRNEEVISRYHGYKGNFESKINKKKQIKEQSCKVCGVEKPLGKFSKSSGSFLGVQSICKDCDKEYYQSNKDKIKKQQAVYYQNNQDKIKEYQKKYRDANKDKIMEYQKNYKNKRKNN